LKEEDQKALQTNIGPQAVSIEQCGWSIQLEDSPSQTKTPCCGADEIRQLVPGNSFGGDLVDLILGSVAPPKLVRIICLSTEVYFGIQKGDLGYAREGFLTLPREKRQWLLPICDGDHWVAVRIDWDLAVMRYYNPLIGASAEVRMKEIVRVTTHAPSLFFPFTAPD
jgi:hypothetical protein